MNGYSYIKLKKSNNKYIDNIIKELEVSPVVAKLLVNRGITNIDECRSFINPKLDYLNDPFLLSDMSLSVDRIIKAINNKEKIWIYGDYDVDGVTSTSILVLFFKSIGVNVEYYIPNRFTEGYGLNKDAIDFIIDNGGDLVITVDCGITSVDEVIHCNESKLDIIITDHHTCQEVIPNAFSVINPVKPNDNYPFKKLAGVGVSFKLLQALASKLNCEIDINQILPIVAIGTVADVVPLIGENRILVKNGLDIMNESKNNGVNALLEVTGLLNKKITAGHIGFVLGPRINATGRIDSARFGVELFISESYEDAFELAKKLDEENKKRQEIEGRILEEAEKIITSKLDLDKDLVLVIDSNNWHHGVIGIVSSRITEKYYKPSVLISIEENEGRGSARSIPNFDIFDSMNKCKSLFKKFGGHKQAAGLSIAKENIDEFRVKINSIAREILTDEDLIPEIIVESILGKDEITISNINQLKILEPYGMGNPSPVFLLKDAHISSLRKIGKEENHLKMTIRLDNENFDCIGFNKGYLYDSLCIGDKIDIVSTLDINEFRGKINIQLIIKDIKKGHLGFDDIEESYFDSFFDKFINNIDNVDIENINLKKEENKLEYTFNKLYDEENVLVLVNSYENADKLIKELEVRGRDYIKEIGISFCELQNKKANNILINGNVNSLNLNDFNVIINYDLLIFDKIKDKFNKIIDLTSLEDVEFFYNNLYNIIPDVEELRAIYKSFVENNVIKCSLENYIINIRKYTNNNLNRWKFKLSLIILKDAGLLEFDLNDKDEITVKLFKTKKKVDIISVPIYSKSLNLLSYIKSTVKDKLTI